MTNIPFIEPGGRLGPIGPDVGAPIAVQVSGPPLIDEPEESQSRNPRRTLAQREAAAKANLATLAQERRRLRTRGAIVAGGLLARLAAQRADLKVAIRTASRGLPERDREAFALFAPEIAQ